MQYKEEELGPETPTSHHLFGRGYFRQPQVECSARQCSPGTLVSLKTNLVSRESSNRTLKPWQRIAYQTPARKS